MTGAKRLDLPGRYLLGHEDLDGDGARELLVAECRDLFVPEAGRLEAVSWNPRRDPAEQVRWSQAQAKFLTREPPLPRTHSTIVARGSEAAVTLWLHGGKEKGFLIASPSEKSETISLVALSRPEPVFSLRVPRCPDLRILSASAGAGEEPASELVVADADTDGYAEILFTGKDGVLYCYGEQ